MDITFPRSVAGSVCVDHRNHSWLRPRTQRLSAKRSGGRAGFSTERLPSFSATTRRMVREMLYS